MSKAKLDREVAKETGFLLKDVANITDLFLRRIMESVSNGEQVVLDGFGKFTLFLQARSTASNLVQYSQAGKKLPRRTTGFKVHFSKSRSTFSRVLARNTEKSRGQTRR